MKKTITLLTAIVLTINAFAVNVWDGSSSPWTNGSGTSSDPYLIETAANLAYLAQKVNEGYQAQGQAVFKGVYFLMTDNFSMNNINWTPIGNVNMNMQGYYFAGIFDGWYHNIEHLHIQSSADVCGLFGGLGDNGIIQRLSVTDSGITSTGTGAGGIVGITFGEAWVYQCSFTGAISISNGGSYCGAGGIAAAAAESSYISECSFRGSITATNSGGFTGAAGAGGIVGIALDSSLIFSCYNTGNITASSFMLNVAAGIVAATLQENSVSVKCCYNVGTVSASTKGGIFGMVSPINPTKDETSIEVWNCYYLNTCGGNTNYGTSKTSAEMQTEDFLAQLDGLHIFVMDNGTNNGYPIHSLTSSRVFEATEITAHSAYLSADLHKGNSEVTRAYLSYGILDSTEITEIDIANNGFVEVTLEDLEPNTFYSFNINMEFDDGVILTSEPHYFETLDNTGISEIQNSNICIYPNPTSDFIFIENIGTQPVSIYSLDGRLVKTVEAANVIDVRDLEEGMYLINIDGTTTKLVINK